MQYFTKETAYRIYTTDALKMVTENTARFASGNYLKSRFSEIINPPPEETRTGEEIIADLRRKLEVG